MTALYAVTLVVGIAALTAWVLFAAIGASVAGWARVDPESRLGILTRLVVAGLFGFGLGGMSATFAGWADPVAFIAAALGSAAIVAIAWRYGPSRENAA